MGPLSLESELCLQKWLVVLGHTWFPSVVLDTIEEIEEYGASFLDMLVDISIALASV